MIMGPFIEFRRSEKLTVMHYSERGVMGMAFATLPEISVEFLLNTGQRTSESDLLKNAIGEYDSCVVLTEFSLGSEGFGFPDGAILFRKGTHSAFVFIEAKIGTFDSAWKTPVEMSPQDLEGDSIDLNESCTSNRLNSSINGQLELRWRFARSICRDNRGSDKVIRETRSITHSRVLSSDRFYWRKRLRMKDDVSSDWRRVVLDDERGALYQLGPQTKFYLLALTGDNVRPSSLDNLRLTGPDGELLSLEQKDEFVYWASFNEFRKTVADHPPIPSPANAAIG